MMDDVTQRGQFGQGQILSKDTQQVIQRTVSSSQTFAEGGREQSEESFPSRRKNKLSSYDKTDATAASSPAIDVSNHHT